MNCINHPEAAVSAYCQNCGKALCAQCVRSVSGVIYCEQCLAARLGIAGAGASYAPPAGAAPFVAAAGLPPATPNPAAAAVLGLIPGVGAMYNGQFIKALVHVLVFVVLIGIASHHGIFGVFIAAWILYQAFDAYHTALARRDGLPLPDPFGLNDLGNRLGFPSRPSPAQAAAGVGHSAYQQPYQSPPATPPAEPYSPYTAYVPPAAVPPFPPPLPPAGCGRSEPVGAIVLIIVGMLFLFSTLGIFRFDWIDHGWPILVIAIGVWLLVRRSHGLNRPEPPSTPPPVPPTGGGQ